jgi:8-oxo-dGTP pyrophosphatase MutT (NUDIX family)
VVDAPLEWGRAAVALLLRPTSEDLEILFIQRPTSVSDPWSGHMALPGGRRNGDENPLETAIRETREEVGIDLESDGILIGRLDELQPGAGGPLVAVAPFVFAVPSEAPITPDPTEVAQVVWIPLAHLTDPASAAEHLHILPGGDHRAFPGLAYHHFVIWGLTYRMIIQFLGIARAAFQEAE